MSYPVRPPRFLSGLPENSAAQPARFTATPARLVLEQATPPPPQPPPADVAAIRREAMERVAAAVATLRAQSDRAAEQARADAVEIGFQVARKVIGLEIRQSPEALFSLVRSALQRAGESRRLAVRLAPEDVPLLEAENGRAALDGLSAARVELVPDPSLRQGDCVVEADFGQVDGRLATRLAEIRRAVDASAVEGIG